MEKSFVKLYLNEVGKKAMNTDIKAIHVDAKVDEINDEYIDNIFPLSLVEKYEVKDSFLNLKIDDYVIVIQNGKRLLGKVSGQWRNQLHIYVYSKPYTEYLNFRADGVEATHCKNKAMLEKITQEELKKFQHAMINEPFVEILNMFNENHENIKFDPAEIVLPHWLTTDVINDIKNVVLEAKDEEIDSFDDKF